MPWRGNLCEPGVKDAARRRARMRPSSSLRRLVSRRPIALALLACSLVAVGCGGGDDADDTQAPPQATPDQFPRATGRTLAELRQDLPKGGPVLAPTVSRFVTGKNRLGFGLFTTARAQIADASAAVYIAPVGGGEAQGPFVAHYESLAVKPPYVSQTTSKDPDAAKTLYVADVPFKKPGQVRGAGDGAAGRQAGRRQAGDARARGVAEGQGQRCRPSARPRRGSTRRRRRRSAATSPRSTRATRTTTCTRSTSPTRSARSRPCCCSPRRCCARAGSAARSWTSRPRSRTSSATRRTSSTWRSTTTTRSPRARGRR